jgi:hypothetical protein
VIAGDIKNRQKLVGGINSRQSVGGSLIPRGNDGISPTIEVEEIDGGARVTITDIKGVKTFEIAGGASEEQVERIIEKYLEENPIDVGVQFETDHTLKLEDGVLSVNTTNLMEQDNTLPITSAGVYATVGNIEALLKTI